jgi:ribosomal protein S27AE
MEDGHTVIELTERCPRCGTTFVSGYLQGRLRSINHDCPTCGNGLAPGRKIRTQTETRRESSRQPVVTR